MDVVIAAPAAVLAPVVLAEEDPAAQIGPGLIAFTIVALLAVATFLLIRSMLHHLKKVPPTFDNESPGDVAGPSDPTDPTSASDSDVRP